MTKENTTLPPEEHEESNELVDEERERVMRFLRFAGFILLVIIFWYAFDIANL